MSKKKTDIDRAIEACEAKIKIEKEVLARLLEAKQAATTARLRRKDSRKPPPVSS